MPNYIRLREEGGTFFFTVVAHQRRAFLTKPLARQCLRSAWLETQERFPFETVAVCLMPDHLHTIWALPEDDSDYDKRWLYLKARFSRMYRQNGGVEGWCSASRRRRKERGFWQRRFWEHKIRDDEDLRHHFDYVHYNPVKHELVEWPEQWPWSTFHRYARMGWYGADWGSSLIDSIKGMECE